MNLNPLKWFRGDSNPPPRGRKTNDMASSAMIRIGQQLGPWDAMLRMFIPHQVNPYFLEALREALPLIDGGIGKMIMLDGLIRFDGTDKGLCAEITAAMAELPVNDCETGIQTAYQLHSNEIYEQGFGHGEMILAGKRSQLTGVRIGDSKGFIARRNETGNLEWWYRPPSWKITTRRDGTDQVEVVLRNNIVNVTPGYLSTLNFLPMDPTRLFYGSFNPEADNPYGVSVIRSIEFVSQNLLKIHNATGNAWDRFGDPPFQLTYKTKNRSLKGPDLDKRRNQLGDDLAATLNAKRNGNSADFVQAIGADDEITINVIGAKGDILEIESPAKHFVEQILAKIPVPGWMLGVSEAQAGRMADQQSEIVLMESRTRFERRKPGLKQIVQTWLRGQGITWKPGAWDVVQELPNLRDVMKQAQARFLNAQASMMDGGGVDNPPTPTGVSVSLGGDPNQNKSVVIKTRMSRKGDMITEVRTSQRTSKTAACKHTKGANDDDESGEPWAEDDAALIGIEQTAIDGVLALWQQLEDDTIADLGLLEKGAAGEAVWTFNAAATLQKLQARLDEFIAAAGGVDGPVIRGAFDAFVRGLENAASEFDAQVAIDEFRETISVDIEARGLELVKNAAIRSYHDGIIDQLTQGAFDGENPETVAARLSTQFDVGDYDLSRLARSEVARAQGAGKLSEYEKLGVEKVNFVTAGGACPICEGLADDGPYDLDDAPVPVDDSHPNCRCTIRAVDPAKPDQSADDTET